MGKEVSFTGMGGKTERETESGKRGNQPEVGGTIPNTPPQFRLVWTRPKLVGEPGHRPRRLGAHTRK